MKDWDNLCERFLALRENRNFQTEIKPLKDDLNKNKSRLSGEDFEWLAAALLDEKKKWFVVFLIKEVFGNVSKKLYSAMIRAAVYEENPSFNRSFIEPCLKTFGHRKVNEDLLEYLENGSNREKAGAASAFYWAEGKLKFPVNVPDYSFENATSESKELVLSLTDIEQRRNNLFLKEFVANEDSDVRRRIIPQLKLKVEKYPDELKPLVAQAIEIARSSRDEYIKHRVEVQLGNEKVFKPLPPIER